MLLTTHTQPTLRPLALYDYQNLSTNTRNQWRISFVVCMMWSKYTTRFLEMILSAKFLWTKQNY